MLNIQYVVREINTGKFLNPGHYLVSDLSMARLFPKIGTAKTFRRPVFVQDLYGKFTVPARYEYVEVELEIKLRSSINE